MRTQRLGAGIAETFEQTITQKGSSGRRHRCELTVPDATPPLTFYAGLLVNGVIVANDRYEWTGADLKDPSYGHGGDRFALMGCTAGPPCRLEAVITSRNNAASERLGCYIDAYGTTSLRGDSVPGSTLADDFTTARPKMRQALLASTAGATQGHTCVLRELGEPTIVSSSFVLDVLLNDVSLFTSPYAGTAPNAAFPSDPSPLPELGIARAGVSGSDQLIKHIVQKNAGTITPGDKVTCTGTYTDGTGSMTLNGTVGGTGMRLTTSSCTTPNACNAPPSVSLTSHLGAEAYVSTTGSTITWTASDPDGDALTFDLDYSDDAGATWSSITTGEAGSSYAWDMSALPQGVQYRVRITADDGFGNTASDTSDGNFGVSAFLVTYDGTVQAILGSNCSGKSCHDTGASKEKLFKWDVYSDPLDGNGAYEKRDRIIARTSDDSMPPGGASVPAPDKELLQLWVWGGAPEN